MSNDELKRRVEKCNMYCDIIKFKDTCNKILINEGLIDWRIKYGTGGGLCVENHNEIWMNEANKMDLALFLHEVAHALCPKEKYPDFYKIDKTGHFSIWGDCFTSLVRKYMIHRK